MGLVLQYFLDDSVSDLILYYLFSFSFGGFLAACGAQFWYIMAVKQDFAIYMHRVRTNALSNVAILLFFDSLRSKKSISNYMLLVLGYMEIGLIFFMQFFYAIAAFDHFGFLFAEAGAAIIAALWRWYLEPKKRKMRKLAQSGTTY